MSNKDKIIDVLSTELFKLDSVHAMWLEGSLADNNNDEYSDLDLWLSVDDEKFMSIYNDVEATLETISPIDFKLVLKSSGELGHNVYHLQGMDEFLTLDINTQKASRDVALIEGIDIYETIFDKSGVIKEAQRDVVGFNKNIELAELLKFIDYTALSVKKNSLRGNNIESREYYRNILTRVSEYLRDKAGIPEKAAFEFKHIYRDLPKREVEKLEEFYFSDVDDHTIASLEAWLRLI